jgi:predicted metal-dependent hydrolase
MLEDRLLPVVLRRTSNAGRLTMRLAPDGSEVRVTLPRWGRTAEALAFVDSRRAWLSQQLLGLAERRPVLSGSVITYRGAELIVSHDRTAGRKPQPDGGQLRCGGPAEALERRVRAWLRDQAKALSQGDLSQYCTQIDRAPPPLALSNAGRRWGSCASNGTIRINWRLVMAPDFVRRSVVAHEVAHLVHFDHSPRFHALLAEIYEADISAANAWLRRNGRSLYSLF